MFPCQVSSLARRPIFLLLAAYSSVNDNTAAGMLDPVGFGLVLIFILVLFYAFRHQY